MIQVVGRPGSETTTIESAAAIHRLDLTRRWSELRKLSDALIFFSLDEGSVTRLTKRQFRLLLLIYVALIVVGVVIALPQRTHLTQAEVTEAKSSFYLQDLSDYQFARLMVWFLGASLMAWLVGLISLFLLWRPGVYVFLAGVCARLIIEYLRHLRFTSAWSFYGGVEVLLEFAIVAVAIFGPAKHLFQRQGEMRI